MSDHTIAEMAAGRERLRKAIFIACKDFEREFEVEISDLSIAREQIGTYERPWRTVLASVSVEIRL